MCITGIGAKKKCKYALQSLDYSGVRWVALCPWPRRPGLQIEDIGVGQGAHVALRVW